MVPVYRRRAVCGENYVTCCTCRSRAYCNHCCERQAADHLPVRAHVRQMEDVRIAGGRVRQVDRQIDRRDLTRRELDVHLVAGLES